MIVRELLTRLGFDADNDGVKKHERALKNIRIAAAAAATKTAAIGGAMLIAARKTATAGVEIDRFARLSNASTNEFQRMAAGAESVGIQGEKLSDILKDMNDRVGDFVQTGGGPMLDFFEQIAPKVGVTVESFKNLSGPQALQLYVSSLEKANLSQADMVFYMEAIASDSTALLPILQDNGAALTDIADRAERFGAILSDDVIKAGKNFQSSFRGVHQIVQGLTYTVGEKLLPTMTQAVSSFVDWYDANQSIIRQGLTSIISAIVAVFDRAWRVGMRFFDAGMMLVGMFDTLEGSAVPLAAALFLMRRRLGGIMWVLKAGGLLLLLDDLTAWMAGQDSLIGSLVGSYDDFAAALGKLSIKLSELFQLVGVPSDMADSLATLSLALGGLLGYRLGVGLFGIAATAMGGGLTVLAAGLGSLAASAAVAGLAGLRSLAFGGVLLTGWLMSGVATAATALGAGLTALAVGLGSLAASAALAGLAGLRSLAMGGILLTGGLMSGVATAATALGAGLTALAVGLGSLASSAALTGLATLARVSALAGSAATAGVLTLAAGGGVTRIEGNQERPTGGLYDWWTKRNEPDAAQALAATGGGSSNVTNNIKMELPPGTPQSQVDYVKEQVTPFINSALNDAVGRTMQNYTRAE